MRISLFEADRIWRPGSLIPVDGSPPYTEADWPMDGYLFFARPGWSVDFNEEYNSGFDFDEIYNRTIEEIREFPDILTPRINVRGEGDFTIYGSPYSERIFGGTGNDWLSGGDDGPDGEADYLVGAAGDDTYVVANGATEVVEFAYDQYDEWPQDNVDAGGWDRVIASVDFTLPDFVEQLELRGGAIQGSGNALANVLIGSDAANRLYGLDGDDRISGGAGNDRLDGGNGDDRLDGGKNQDILIGGAGDDVAIGGFQNDQALGGAGNDRLYGDLASTIGAGSRGGNDTLNGEDGDDILFGDALTIVAGGSGGRDRLEGGEGNDRLYGDAESLSENARGGDDFLLGGAGDDYLFGGGAFAAGSYGGDDRLDGGTGNDRLWGGSGADRFLFGSGFGNDVIEDFDGAGAGDRIDLSAFALEWSALDISYDSAGALIRAEAFGPSSILLTGIGSLQPGDFLF